MFELCFQLRLVASRIRTVINRLGTSLYVHVALGPNKMIFRVGRSDNFKRQ